MKVDIALLKRNIAILKRRSKRIFAVVKANAYGHGLAVAKYIQNLVDGFAVANEDEAEYLKNVVGVKNPIMILGRISRDYDAEGVIPTVVNADDVKFCFEHGIDKISVKLNTGMNRLGADEKEYKKIIDICRRNSIQIYSTFSHLYKAEDKYCADLQFKELMRLVTPYSVETGYLHIEATNCLYTCYNLDLTRCGIGLYGYPDGFGLSPVASIQASIAQIFKINKGGHIGYGDYTATEDMLIATIRAGYGDGIQRITSKPRFVSVCGVKCKVLGQICMDMLMVDVSRVDVCINMPVYILGGAVSGEELADSSDTIIYEILSSVSSRVKREYVE